MNVKFPATAPNGERRIGVPRFGDARPPALGRLAMRLVLSAQASVD